MDGDENGVIFETHRPAPPHDTFIESVFHYKGLQPDHSIERVVPTGHVFLIFELDGMERHTFDNETHEPNASYQAVWVSGIQRNYITISAHQNSEMFVIQFKAFGARPFLHLSMDEIADDVCAGARFKGAELLALRERLKNANSSADKFAVADEWLDLRFDASLGPPDSIIDVVDRLHEQPASKLNAVIDTYAGTQKHLINQFKKYIGITPKHYQRILRFNDVFVQMQGDQFLSWSDIAYRCGYSDQSHFIREFKRFSGFNPQGFLKEQFEDEAENFFPLDRNG